MTAAKPTAPALTPAPHELAALAHATAGVDREPLVNYLIGQLQAGVPWPELLRLTHLWLQTSADIRDLRTAVATWQRSHPNPQGART